LVRFDFEVKISSILVFLRELKVNADALVCLVTDGCQAVGTTRVRVRLFAYTVALICDESGNPMNKGEGGLKSEYTDADYELGRNERSRFAPGRN
jgi:hypothetical protein